METDQGKNIRYVTAEYGAQIESDYAGNPLIEALPPVLSEDQIIEGLQCEPEINEEERQLEAHYRYNLVMRLFRDFFQPFPFHVEIAQTLSTVIRESYIARNPFSVGHADRLQQTYKAIKAGKFNSDHGFTSKASARGFTVIGISGVGKSTGIERILHQFYPQVILHSEYKGEKLSLFQLTWLKLDCPHDGSLKALCIRFFEKVDELLKTNYSQKFVSSKSSVDTLVPKMAQVAVNHCLGALIIDEIQHLNEAKSGGSRKMLNFFVSLVNTLGVPVILVGTPSAMLTIQNQFRQARRGSGIRDFSLDRMEKDQWWDMFIEAMWDYQWTSDKAQLNDEFEKVIYEESQGIINIAVQLFIMAQIRVLSLEDEGQTKITPGIIQKEAKESLGLVRPMLDALRQGNIEELAKYDDLTLCDINEWHERNTRSLKTLQDADAFRKNKKNQQEKQKQSNVEQVIQRLLDIGIEAKVAQKCAENVIRKYGEEEIEIDWAAREAAALALRTEPDKQTVTSNKKNKSKKTQPTEENDLRIILERSKKSKTPIYEALISKGYIKPPCRELLELDQT